MVDIIDNIYAIDENESVDSVIERLERLEQLRNGMPISDSVPGLDGPIEDCRVFVQSYVDHAENAAAQDLYSKS